MTKKPPGMATHHDSEVQSSGLNVDIAEDLGFDSDMNTSFSNFTALPEPFSSSNSGVEDADTRSREVGGDSGLSGMELTSPGTSPDPNPSGRSRYYTTTGRSPFRRRNVEGMDVPEEDDDDCSSTISELSGMSDLSGQDWKPKVGSRMTWVQKQMMNGADPRELLSHLLQDDTSLEGISDLTLWKLIINLLSEVPRRKKLPDVNTLDDVVRLIKSSKKILVLTGAGVSVSCGIPDFRSPTGIYARLSRDFPDLPGPQAMFDIHYFNRDPRPFYKFAREIYPGQFQPSPCHRFIRALETHGKLLRNYTQNIDTLEQVAGIEKVVQCHGSFATATCTNCKRKVTADEIRDDILSQRIPVCTVCVPDGSQLPLGNVETSYQGLVARGVMKPDIVFFGEGLPEDFHRAMAADRDECDLLLIIGSSLKVRPVALIPSSVPSNVPQILINREPLPDLTVDVELLGYADVLVDYLCNALGEDWKELCWRNAPMTAAPELLSEEFIIQQPSNPLLPPPMEISRKRPPTDPESHEPPKRQRIEESDEPSGSSPPLEEPWKDMRHIKFRQMSSDSTRDSGIVEDKPLIPPISMSQRLPENTYFLMEPNCYVFPGAEIYPSRRRRRYCISDSDLEHSSSPESPSSSPLPSTSVPVG